MASRIVQYFADKLKSMKEYPITLTKAVYDENGNRLDNKLSEIDNNITGLNSSLNSIIVSTKINQRIFRGKNIGSSLTATQLASIKSGTFDDLWLGDYWVINNITWRIVDFDYWLLCGDTSFDKHHLVIMPDVPLYNAQMNTTNVTTGGYVGSAMYTSNLANAKTIVNNAFGSAVLTHTELLNNAVTNGYPSGGSWYDSSVEIPNEPMMYGSYVHTPASDGSIIPYRYTINKSQLALFAVCPWFIHNRQIFWLRDPVSAATFARVRDTGHTDYGVASDFIGVRPVFPVG